MPPFIDQHDAYPLTFDAENDTNAIRAYISMGGNYTCIPESMSSETALNNLFIITETGICQGEPIVSGTRVSVSNIVELYYWLGWDIEKIKHEYPYLTEQQIIGALEYYRDHMTEIDSYVEAEREIDGE